MIKKTGSDKHMWNCATTIQFLEFLTVELRERRLELGLAAKDGALSICDDAEQHRNPQYLQLRKQWEKENNCILLGCDPEQRVPGGCLHTHTPKISIYKVWCVTLHAYIHTYIQWFTVIRTYRASQPASRGARQQDNTYIHTYIHPYTDIHSGQGVHTYRVLEHVWGQPPVRQPASQPASQPAKPYIQTHIGLWLTFIDTYIQTSVCTYIHTHIHT